MSSSDPIVFECGCGQKFKAALRLGGRQLKCPSCGQQTIVPLPTPPEVKPFEVVFEPEPVRPLLQPIDELPARVIKRRKISRQGRVWTVVAGSLSASLMAWWGVVEWRRIPTSAADLRPRHIAALEKGAIDQVKAKVTKALTAPSTAVFSADFETESATLLESNSWQTMLTGWVESQNAYGVPLRNGVVATLVYDVDAGTWSTFSLKLGEEYLEMDESLRRVGMLLADCREVGRLTGNGNEETREFTIYKDWWRFTVSAGERGTIADVLDPRGATVKHVEVDAFRDWTEVVQQKGTFRIQVASERQWEIVVEEPL